MSTNKSSNIGRDEAVQAVRGKIDRLYANEPSADEELKEALNPGKHSKHQVYLLELHNSGLSMEDIQVKWHSYYAGLDKDAKQEVWKEFYANQEEIQTSPATSKKEEPSTPQQPKQPHSNMIKLADLESDRLSAQGKVDEEARKRALSKSKRRLKVKERAGSRGRKQNGLTKLQHLKSLGFGLAISFVFLFITMFTFFNEKFIVPFIRPGTLYASSQIITVPNAVVSSEPRVIIPKLNIEAPVVYDVQFIAPGETEDDFENRIQESLEGGVVHYPTSQKPGEAGQGFNSNTVIVGHSSNNIFSRGDYKFAFMQLRELVDGDIIMLNYEGKQYVYKVYEKKVVKPTEVSILGAASRPNSVTLITCDPPGFNINRMVIVAEQISPDPLKNVVAEPPERTPSTVSAGQVPGQPDNLLRRVWDAIF